MADATRRAPSSHSDLVELVERMSGRRVLVHADIVADEFVETDAPRVSREAPVLIVRYRESRLVPGGGANAAANIAALGGVPVLVGEVGDDDVGRRLVDGLRENGADTTGVLVRAGGVAPRKTRYLAGDKNVVRQQVVRVDRIEPFVHDEPFFRDLKATLLRALENIDGILVSDYGLGFVDPESVDALILQSPARRGVKVALDSRWRLFEYEGVDVATPSEPELEEALDRELNGLDAVEKAARESRSRLAAECLVVTRGRLGLVVVDGDEASLDVPAFGHGTVTDVTGAGDTVVATLALALAAGASYRDAARLANVAAGMAVTRMGTATVSAEELAAALVTD